MRKFATLTIALFVFMTLFSGCGPSKEKRIIRIADLEKRLFSPEAVSFNKESADSLVTMYSEFTEQYPDDTNSSGFLFKAANVTMNNNDPQRAIGFFDRYIEKYPKAPKAPMCLFFKGFIYENMLHDLDRAREVYLTFIEKYPSDEFVDDAQMALKNLGKTPEMLIREFEEKQRADSARIADSIAIAGKKRR
jgi:outer membrane protein assembly factor BamD (BamD/ComL family)